MGQPFVVMAQASLSSDMPVCQDKEMCEGRRPTVFFLSHKHFDKTRLRKIIEFAVDFFLNYYYYFKGTLLTLITFDFPKS